MSMNVDCKVKIYLYDMQGKRPDIPEFFSLRDQHTSCGWGVAR